ncbi:major facilitator superfamily domain-containing protein [Mycena leptocephala]|nr:major facilitator superfamily domain-containing protein [Mycena leptocephala]
MPTLGSPHRVAAPACYRLRVLYKSRRWRRFTNYILMVSSQSSQHRAVAASQHNANLLPVDDSTSEAVAPTVQPEDPVTEDEEARKAREKMPLWKRPAPWWLMALTPLSYIILSSTVGAQVELFTDLACRVHRPEFQLTSIDSRSMSPKILPNSLSSVKIIVNNPDFAEMTPAFTPCSSDPAVQAAVAKLTTVITTVMGILTFVTVGWWGSFSDRHGRSRVMGIVALGQLISPLIIILVATYVDLLPGGYYFVIVDAIISGAIGSTASELAAIMAYSSDVSTPEQRSRIFSFVVGSMLAGIGIGPILGSFVLRTTHHNLLSVFYLAAALRLIYASVIWFFLPESLTTVKMKRASIRYRDNPSTTEEPTLWWSSQRLFFFLKPLSLLLPEKISNPTSPKVGKRDWNLTLLVLAYAAMFLAAVGPFLSRLSIFINGNSQSSLANIFLYALFTFQWDAEYLNYCISSIGIARGVFLILILPAVIKFVKDRHTNPPSSHSSSEHEPLLSDNDRSIHPTPPKSAVFDLGLARFSILMDIAMYALLPFAPTGIIFILFISLGSLGGGLVPAINSVALELYTRRIGKNKPVESGKLFGALSVVQAISATVLGPPMYGLIYAATVATHPRTICFVATGNAVFAFVILAFVRVAPDVDDDENVA